MYEFSDPEKWSDYRLENRETYLRETTGNWLTPARKQEKAREIAHIMFELDNRYAAHDVLAEVERIVERGEPAPAEPTA